MFDQDSSTPTEVNAVDAKSNFSATKITIKEILASSPGKKSLVENLSDYYRFAGYRNGDWIALQTLGCKEQKSVGQYLRAGCYSAFVSSPEEAAKMILDIEERQSPQGTYFMPNRIKEGVESRQPKRTWVMDPKGEGLSDGDFSVRRIVYLDLDPDRPRNISATNEQMNATIIRASRVWKEVTPILATILPEGVDPASPLGLGFSGNGAQIHFALADLPSTKGVLALVDRFLKASDLVWGDKEIKVDKNVKEIKRLCPAFGSWKRKGTDDPESGRRHRKSWFVAATETPHRLSEIEFTALVEAVEALVPEDAVEVDGVVSDVDMSGPAPRSAPRATVASKDDAFEAARKVPLREVAQWLGLVEGDAIRCPGCGELVGAGENPKNPQLFHCFHDRCSARPNRTTLDMVTAAKGLKGKDGLKEAYKLMAERFGLPALRGPGRPKKGEGPPHAPPPPPPGSKGEAWEDTLTRLNNGAIASTEANAITILLHTGWPEVIRFNERSHKIECAAPPPWHPDDAPETPAKIGAQWTDEDFDRLRLWLQRYWGLSFGKEAGVTIASIIAEKRSYNTLTSWLRTLPALWDGKKRADKWLHTYTGAEDTPYHSRVGRWWLLQAVARAFEPGCKADYMLIFQGLQGRKKSMFFEVLAGEEHFSDAAITIGDKDSYLLMLGPWIMEMSELDTLVRAEQKAQKAFLARRKDTFRKPYGHVTQDYPRQVVFCGTVNDVEFLRDPSGGRRYWPVSVSDENLDVEGLRRDREQLWAEIVVAYLAGERRWPETAEDNRLCEEEQEDRRVQDPWQEKIAEYLMTKDEVSIPEILDKCLEIKIKDEDGRNSSRVGNILMALRWAVSTRKRASPNDPTRIRFYTRTKSATPRIGSSHAASPGDANDPMVEDAMQKLMEQV